MLVFLQKACGWLLFNLHMASVAIVTCYQWYHGNCMQGISADKDVTNFGKKIEIIVNS